MGCGASTAKPTAVDEARAPSQQPPAALPESSPAPEQPSSAPAAVAPAGDAPAGNAARVPGGPPSYRFTDYRASLAADAVAELDLSRFNIRALAMKSEAPERFSSADLAAALPAAAALRTLRLSGNKLTAAAETDCALLSALSARAGLTTLDLSSNALSDAGVLLLFPATASAPLLRSLESLNLSKCALGDAAAAAFASAVERAAAAGPMPLRVLNVASNDLTTAGAEALARALAHLSALTELNISFNMNVAAPGVAALADAAQKQGVLARVSAMGVSAPADAVEALQRVATANAEKPAPAKPE
jgi:S-DNA-T family DNA segregation ATPase FtsK/SpoIIIE